MRAAYIDEPGPATNIRIGELPAPQIGPTDVLVDVSVTTVNRVDTLIRAGIRAGSYSTPMTFPFIIGRDLVGTVAAVGAGVSGFNAGDWVWCNSLGHGGRQGATAEQAVVPVERLYSLPSGVSAEDAVAVAHPAATAHLALFRHAAVCPGETVLVIGAAGNVGSAAVTMAVEAGARVLAVARSEDAEYCRDLGASDVLDYRAAALARHVHEIAPDGVDVIVDTAGANDLVAAVEMLALRGRIVLLAGMDAQATLPVGPLYVKDGCVRGFAISHATTAELADAARTVNRLLGRGLLRARSITNVPLSDVADAHRRIAEDGGLHGRRLAVHVAQ